MISGIGRYILKVGGQVVPICISNFSLESRINTRNHQGLNYNTGISTTQHADIISKTWILNLTQDLDDYATLGALLNALPVPSTSTINNPDFEVWQTGDSTDSIYNISNPGVEPVDGDVIVRASSISASLEILDDCNNIEVSHCFYGIIFQDGQQAYSIQIDDMRRIRGVTIGTQVSASMAYVASEPIVRTLSSVPALEYTILLAEVPAEYTDNSTTFFYGRVVPNEGVTLDFSQIPINVFFGLSDAPNQTVTPDSNGFILFDYTTASNLSFPNESALTFTDATTNQQFFSQTIQVQNPNININVSQYVAGAQELSITGTAPSGTELLITTVGMNDIVQNEAVLAVDGAWTTDLFSVPVTTAATTFTVTATPTNPNLSPTSSDLSIINYDVDTALITINPTSVGTPTAYSADLVPPNELYQLEVSDGTNTLITLEAISSNEGLVFFRDIEVPVALQGSVISFLLTQVSNNDTRLSNEVYGLFNELLTLNLDAGPFYSGFTPVSGTYNASSGYPARVLTSNTSTLSSLIFDTYLDTESATQSFSVPTEYNAAVTRSIFVAVDSNLHSGPEIVGPVVLNHGLRMRFGSSTDQNTTIGETVNIFLESRSGSKDYQLDVFGQTFTFNGISSTSQQFPIVVPPGASFGTNTAVLTLLDPPGYPFQATLDFNVIDSTLRFEPTPPSLLVFEPGVINDIVQGFAELGSNVFVDVSGLNGSQTNISRLVDNSTYTWDFSRLINWQPTQSFTISADQNANNILYTGTAESRIHDFNETRAHGDTASVATFRGPDNRLMIVEIPDLEINEVITTDANGFGNINLPEIPRETFAPVSYAVTIETQDLTQLETFTLNIVPRVPISINLIKPADGMPNNVIQVNSSFNVVGDVPTDINATNFSAIGAESVFSVDVFAADAYSATLTTSVESGDLDLFINTLYQENAELNLVVSPLLNFSGLPAVINEGDMFDITFTGVIGERLLFKLESDTQGVLIDTDIVFTSTTHIESIDATGFESQTLTFTIGNQYFTFPAEERRIVSTIQPIVELFESDVANLYGWFSLGWYESRSSAFTNVLNPGRNAMRVLLIEAATGFFDRYNTSADFTYYYTETVQGSNVWPVYQNSLINRTIISGAPIDLSGSAGWSFVIISATSTGTSGAAPRYLVHVANDSKRFATNLRDKSIFDFYISMAGQNVGTPTISCQLFGQTITVEQQIPDFSPASNPGGVYVVTYEPNPSGDIVILYYRSEELARFEFTQSNSFSDSFFFLDQHNSYHNAFGLYNKVLSLEEIQVFQPNGRIIRPFAKVLPTNSSGTKAINIFANSAFGERGLEDASLVNTPVIEALNTSDLPTKSVDVNGMPVLSFDGTQRLEFEVNPNNAASIVLPEFLIVFRRTAASATPETLIEFANVSDVFDYIKIEFVGVDTLRVTTRSSIRDIIYPVSQNGSIVELHINNPNSAYTLANTSAEYVFNGYRPPITDVTITSTSLSIVSPFATIGSNLNNTGNFTGDIFLVKSDNIATTSDNDPVAATTYNQSFITGASNIFPNQSAALFQACGFSNTADAVQPNRPIRQLYR